MASSTQDYEKIIDILEYENDQLLLDNKILKDNILYLLTRAHGKEAWLWVDDHIKDFREMFLSGKINKKDYGPGRKEPMDQANELYVALSEAITTESLDKWLIAPNNAFDGLKPIEIIEHGEIDRLWEMVFRLRNGTPG